MIEEENITESKAFMEYKHGRSPKIRPPWLVIVIVGVTVAVACILTEVFAEYALQNRYALNFLIALYGIPGGFVVALKNKTFSALISIRYAAFSGLIFTGTFMSISLIIMLVRGHFSSASTIGSFFLMTVLIAFFSVVFTFSFGALLGTFTAGVIDDKKQ
ncbi:MAG: hypothetical protein FK733_12920 [Asgard group archaeon]|nr:hypothetical protein [Asgard group archaeon]